MTLKNLKHGEKGRIITVEAQGILSQKLSDMGFIPGREVKMVRYAPFRDPVEVNLVGYNVGIRRDEAEFVHVESIA